MKNENPQAHIKLKLVGLSLGAGAIAAFLLFVVGLPRPIAGFVAGGILVIALRQIYEGKNESAMGKHIQDGLIEQVSTKIDRPVLAAAMFQRAHANSSLLLGPLSGLASTVLFFKGKKKASGLPQAVILAVTADHVYALNATNRQRKEVARWSRSGIRASTLEGQFGTKFVLEPSGGERVELEVAMGQKQAVADMIRLLNGATDVSSNTNILVGSMA